MGRKSSPGALKKRGKNGRSPTGKVRLRSLDDMDMRTASAQAIKRTRDRMIRDLGGDLSAMQIETVNWASALSAMLQDAVVAYTCGEPVDKLGFGTLAGHQRRLLADLGYSRVAKDVTPDLEDLIEQQVAA